MSLNLKYPQRAAVSGHKILWSVLFSFFSLRVRMVLFGGGGGN